MRKWRNLKGWQKGSLIGFFVLGIIHVLFVTHDLIFYSGRSITHPFGIPIFEWPLFVLYGFFYLMFKIEILPTPNGIYFWIFIYIVGTITWGVVGSLPGFILGLISDIYRASSQRNVLIAQKNGLCNRQKDAK